MALGYPLDLMLGPTVALFLLVSMHQSANKAGSMTAAIAIALLVAYLGVTAVTHQKFPGTELLHTGLAWAAAWFAGERTRLRREQMTELRERAVRAEQERERERQLAAAEERARIARDLHDSAAHAINVIAVRAGSARLRHREDPDRSLPALEAIEELARSTVDEIDQIVKSLRQGRDQAVEPPPGLSSLSS